MEYFKVNGAGSKSRDAEGTGLRNPGAGTGGGRTGSQAQSRCSPDSGYKLQPLPFPRRGSSALGPSPPTPTACPRRPGSQGGIPGG